MKIVRPDIAAMALVGLVIVAATVCAVLRVPVPEFLTSIALFIAGIGGGVAIPTGSTSTNSPAPAPAAAPQPVAQSVAPAALAADPATGVFRVASHAP